MSLKWTRARLLPLFFAVAFSLAVIVQTEVIGEDGSKMSDIEPIQIITGEHIQSVPSNELPALGEALRHALKDAELVARSRAPRVFLKDLPQSVDEVKYSEETGEVRAGDWILVADADGLFWQNRIVPPDPPQIGLMFVARVVRSEEGWVVPSLTFQRLR